MDHADLATAKAAMRAEALAARDALSPTTAIENALALVDHASAVGDVIEAVVAAYWPIRSEIDPRPLLFALREAGARTCLPVIVNGEIVFRELTRETELEPAGFGTFGPGSEAATVDPDVILLPLAAFDASGARLGYGKGHYDRAIAACRARGLTPRLVGLAHAAQERVRVPTGPYDIRLHAVLCEDGLHAMSAS